MTIQILRTARPDNPPSELAAGQLAVEMATYPPRLWCGVPTSIDPSGRIEVAVSGEDAGGDYSTGDGKLTLQTYADPGWILMDDGTIGDSQSGATTRANADCEALFLLLWNNIEVGPYVAVLPSRGESDIEDWEAHKQIRLPRQLGCAIIGAGQGAGLSNRPLASFSGEDSHTQTGAELPQHNHGFESGSHQHVGGQAMANGISNGYHWCPTWSTDLTFMAWGGISGGEVTVAWAGSGLSISANGSGGGLNVTQASAAWNIMLKL